MGLLNPHLDDAALADLWAGQVAHADGPVSGSAEKHLRACGECRARYEGFGAWLAGIAAEARAEAEEALTPERLAVQQAQIARRLETLEAPGRVIAFPRFTRAVATRPTRRNGWIAGAAAAGLVVGLGLGQIINYQEAPSASSAAAGPAALPQLARGDGRIGAQPAAYLSDEIFFDDHDLSPSSARVPDSLQYLNVITPSARDYDSR